jgi:HlyD family secretion protein
MKKPIIALLVVLLGVGGYYALNGLGDGENGGNLTLYGNVDIREVQLGFRVAGRLAEMHVEEGDAIAAGQLLAVLEDTPQKESLAIADAGVAQAAAQLKLLQQGARPQEIEQARAAVEEAEAGLANAEHEFTRQAELVKQELSSERLLDQARSSRDQWAARLSQSREGLDLAEEGFRSEEIEKAVAALAAAQAQSDRAATQLSDTRLFAPSSGVVMTRVLEPGAMVGVGTPAYALSLTEVVYVRAYVDEPNLGHVKPGAKVVVTTDTEGREYEGQVGFISPRAEFTPKSVETPALRTDLVYRLRIVVKNSDDMLRQGMPITVTIPGA